jgi:hypothetical protein
MELLLILIYVSICYAVFKVFRIPVNHGRWQPRRWAESSVSRYCY